MKPTIRQLAIFAELARSKSVTQAAKNLHLSQPAVSIQIRQLEEQAGLDLFEYSGRSFRLTYAGQIMLECATGVHSILADTTAKLEQMKDAKTGHLDIAVVSTAHGFVANLLANFLVDYPHITFSIKVTNRRQLLELAEERAADFIIMGEPPEKLATSAEKIMENPLVIIANPEHHLVKHKTVSLATVAKEAFVVREAGSGTREALYRLCKQHGITLSPRLEFSSSGAIKEAVQAGLGLALVSRHTIRAELKAETVVVLAVKHTPLIRHWHLVVPPGKRLSPMAARFRAFLLEEAGNMAL
jgi:LysR family transcriptional regulator, low CO2-responsive transcriptional regulator